MNANLSTITPDFDQIEREGRWRQLQDSANAVLWATRSVLDTAEDVESVEAAQYVLTFLEDIRDDVRTFNRATRKPSLVEQLDLLEIWAFEIRYALEQSRFHEVDDRTDTLVQLLAESCIWLQELLPLGIQVGDLRERYSALHEAICDEAISIASLRAVDLAPAA